MTQTDKTPRQRWMQVLARAGRDLLAYREALLALPHADIRAPQAGMVMVRGRAGGTGAAFNAGEAVVCRCVVRMDDGKLGHAYVLGRDLLVARLAAIADGALQGADSARWQTQLLAPLQQAQQARQAQRRSEVAGSKVDFFTMVRGD